MRIIDYLIVILPMIFIFWMAFYSKRFIRGVSDFLVAGRVCGRYVLSVASDAAGGMGLLTLVAYVEVHYKTGFAINFWRNLAIPVGTLLALVGFVSYRYRETKVMSFGQFLEMRYNRALRIFAGALRSFAEMLASMIAPALAARFFIYILDLPHRFSVFGFQVDTFVLLIVLVTAMAVSIILIGGQIAIIVTDTLQGLLIFPLLVVFVGYMLYHFSWSGEIVPVMLDRVPQESFLNPYDMSALRDFNLFAFGVSLFGTFFHAGSWIGSGAAGAGRSAHEQKMAGVLGPLRGGAHGIFCVLLAVMILAFLNHKNFANDAKVVRDTLSVKIADEIFENQKIKDDIAASVKAIPVQIHTIGQDAPLSDKKNLDTPYFETIAKSVEANNEQNSKVQEFRTLFFQLMMPATLRHLLPVGLLGAFALLMIMFMLSTDDSRIFSSASTIAQDVILPFIKKELTPEQHVKLIKGCSIGVGIFFICGSTFMAQLDYINLFVQIVCALWTGGCGPVMLGGLYCRFGNTAGAFASLIFGMFTSIFAIFTQRNWADVIYPWLERNGWVDNVASALTTLSKPFNPIIVWEMNPYKCPINSIEIYAMTMLISIVIYVGVSYLTYKGPFNLERMLHRGIYNTGEPKPEKTKWTFRNVYSKLLGITSEYSKADKIIAHTVFTYQFTWKLGILFAAVVIWNVFSPFTKSQWGNYFLIQALLVPGLIAFISTFWFGIGGIIDLRKMFKALRERIDNPLDNGRVEGDISIVDKENFAKVESEQKK